MKETFTYFKLECKRAWKHLPLFLTGAIMLAALLSIIALLAGKALYGEGAVGRIQVGVILPPEDYLSEQAVRALGSMESVESICDFQYVTEEEGEKGLKDGSLAALLIVPENFVTGIIDGTNQPIDTVLREPLSLESLALKEITSAGARTLSTAQAAIYAADELCILENQRDFIPQTEAELNRIYMNYSLNRDVYFMENKVSAAGDIGAVEYFAMSGAVLLLIFCGIPASPLMGKRSKVFCQKLKFLGIGNKAYITGEILSVWMLLLAVCITVAAVCLYKGIIQWEAAVMQWSVFLLVSLAAAAIITAVYEGAGSQIPAMMILFWGGILMAFLCGGILPSSFLPEGVKTVGNFLPFKPMMDGVQYAVTGTGEGLQIGFALSGIIVLAFFAAVLGRKRYG